MAIWAIFCGCVAIVIGLAGKVFYGANDARTDSAETPIPTWLGKTLFIGIGILFTLVGFMMLWKELLQK
jgi:hypothetical protein